MIKRSHQVLTSADNGPSCWGLPCQSTVTSIQSLDCASMCDARSPAALTAGKGRTQDLPGS